MPDAFLDPIFERIARSQRAGMRIGTLTAIDTGDASVTVDCAGDVVPGVRWVGSYSPVVGDMVVVSRVEAMWVVLGKMSKQIGAPTVTYGTVTVTPSTAWDGYFAEGYWTWAVSPRAGIFGGPPGQGKRYPYGVEETSAGVWYMPSVATAIPTGATVTAATLRLTRWTPNAEQAGLSPEGTLVAPRLYRHTYTTQPVATPTWSGAVWAPGSLLNGQPGGWALPSAWLTDLLTGAATGVGLYSTAAVDWTRFTDLTVDLSYTVPA